MNRYVSLMIALSFLCLSCSRSDTGTSLPGSGDGEGEAVTKTQRIFYADPTIYLENGIYYLTGTSQVGNHSSRGFTVLMSEDLRTWRTDNSDPYRFIIGPEWGNTFGTGGFWAPQWVKTDDGTYRFLYTANEQTAIAEADAPTGIFTQAEAQAIDPSCGNIDPFLFRDDDGKYYLYHVRFGGGNFIWSAEFDMEKGKIEASTLTKCLDLTEPWERMYNYDTSWIMEGPTVVKWDGVYYLFYSANHFMDPDYAVGYAVAATPQGPWTKYAGNPIIRRDIVGEKGSGHGDVFRGKDGNYYYVYHVWGDNDNPHARQTRIVPLIREKGEDGIYKISVDASNIIIPVQEMPLSVLSLKTPGNKARSYPVSFRPAGKGKEVSPATAERPVEISRHVTQTEGGKRICVTLKASQDIYFNYGERINTGYTHKDCRFYMPGFWYRQNLRSPAQAPSFHTSDSWLVRDDRLSTPLTAVFSPADRHSLSVARIDDFGKEALTTHREGEVILSGETSVGYTGFQNYGGTAWLCYGFPYREEPRCYLRKLTLAPPVTAYQRLSRGESLSLTWEVTGREAADFSECVQRTWEYSMDTYSPTPVETPYTAERMKEVLSNFFVESYVAASPVCYYSGVELRTDDCESTDVAEVGFVGRTLLNAFNAVEYGEQTDRNELVEPARRIFDTYLEAGFTPGGFFREVMHLKRGFEEQRLSIRRQSEGIYALLHYLNYEKQHKRKHTEWENHIRHILDNFLRLQQDDGSFPRKFRDNFTLVDSTGGSTPSATPALVMAYKYFNDDRYLQAARRTVDYLDRELISKADYFSSTLDANCEDKEAALAAATATWYLALATQGEEQSHYADLCRKATYFGLSWYYTWDVPFAPGQMLGDLGLQSRGWGNVSVENNHIDVFVFEFADILRWLSTRYNEPRFSRFAEVISTSMRQLLPYEGHRCGIGRTGYYPEVVQHTNWDYGRNGKGFYNNIFAPGWTVASLWELLTPGRAEQFLQ